MRLLIYSGTTVRIDGDFAKYSRLEDRHGERVHVIYFADTDQHRDFKEIAGIHDSHYAAYEVEPVSDYYHNPSSTEKNHHYFSAKRYQRRYR